MPNEIHIALNMDGTADVLEYQDRVSRTVAMEQGITEAPVLTEGPSPLPREPVVLRVLEDRLFVVDRGSPPPGASASS